MLQTPDQRFDINNLDRQQSQRGFCLACAGESMQGRGMKRSKTQEEGQESCSLRGATAQRQAGLSAVM